MQYFIFKSKRTEQNSLDEKQETADTTNLDLFIYTGIFNLL